MHVLHFETWIVFLHVTSCLVTCGSSGTSSVYNDMFGGLSNGKKHNVHRKTPTHISSDLNISKDKEDPLGSSSQKKSSVVENYGNDFYMVRSVINGEGKISGSSVSVLSKENIDLTEGQVSGVSIESRLNKATKIKRQPQINHITKSDETMLPLMDEPIKGK